MSALSLDEVKQHLNLTGTGSDVELQETIDAAERVIGHYVGPLEPTTKRSRVTAHAGALILPVKPVLSITSATDRYSAALTTSELTVDGPTGIVSGYYIRSTDYDVTYIAGWATLPADLKQAVKEMVRHLWKVQRGGAVRPGSAAADTATPGFLVPNVVASMIEPYTSVAVG
jgi:Phage gp6-like head-tail connector protein